MLIYLFVIYKLHEDFKLNVAFNRNSIPCTIPRYKTNIKFDNIVNITQSLFS